MKLHKIEEAFELRPEWTPVLMPPPNPVLEQFLLKLDQLEDSVRRFSFVMHEVSTLVNSPTKGRK